MRGAYTLVGLLVLLSANAMAQTSPFSGRRCSFGGVMDFWGEGGGDGGRHMCAVTNDGVDVVKCTEGKPVAQPKNCGPCLLYTSPSPRDRTRSRMPSSA